ncbi:acyltransferase family-domain-containing protein [Stachybotrys elegans]|uniref:Acyltransferase family-domain-containing protein n=1 Tax=Stachybotrys elegans TaxID=80388 RepID=A0A8K0SGN3_9HYPO|nr:acyltransferase family-domain-containing protein [Stachybotrys elegans]
MNGHASSSDPPAEEKVGLLKETDRDDLESEAGRLHIDDTATITTTTAGTASHSFAKWAASVTATLPTNRSALWRQFTRFLFFLVPSFFQGRHAREQIRPAKLPPTAYLDGMRGLAALFVFFCHYSYQAFAIAEGWGYGGRHQILKLPFIRLFYSGPMAVCVFFVISGYALSYRPLKFIRSGSSAELANTMSSLIFRRGMRLFLPTITSTFMIVILLRIGAYDWTRGFAHSNVYMKRVREPHPERMHSTLAQLGDWIWQTFEFVHVYSWTHFHVNYDVHLWTIPVEFRCSLYLFLTVLGTARLRTAWRFATLAGIIAFTYRKSKWDMMLFFFGMVIAELDHIRGHHVQNPTLPASHKMESNSLWRRAAPWSWVALSIVGLYLMGQPDAKGAETPGWVTLTSMIPEWWSVEKFRFWQSFGAVIFVFAVGRCPGWIWFFNTPVVQYFGKISYAIYLMHGPAIHTVGYHWEKLAWKITGVEGLQYNFGFMLGSLFVIPTVIWWADVFWRAVDIPSVKFAKWVESKLIVKA